MTFITFSPNITFTIDKFLIFIMWTLTNDFVGKYCGFTGKKKVNITYHSIYHHKALSIEGAKV